MRKIPGEVTRKSDGPTNRPRVKTTAQGLRSSCRQKRIEALGIASTSGWDEQIRKSKSRLKLPGRHQETVRFFNAAKKGSASGRMTMTLLKERGRLDDNDARAFLLSNTAEERIEALGIFHA